MSVLKQIDLRIGRFRPVRMVDKCATRSTGTYRASGLVLWHLAGVTCPAASTIGNGKRTLGAAPQVPQQGTRPYGTFLFKCPKTTLSVQGWLDEGISEDENTY